MKIQTKNEFWVHPRLVATLTMCPARHTFLIAALQPIVPVYVAIARLAKSTVPAHRIASIDSKVACAIAKMDAKPHARPNTVPAMLR